MYLTRNWTKSHWLAAAVGVFLTVTLLFSPGCGATSFGLSTRNSGVEMNELFGDMFEEIKAGNIAVNEFGKKALEELGHGWDGLQKEIKKDALAIAP